MSHRGYRTTESVWQKIISVADDYNILPLEELFPGWHNNTYWEICYYNLKEKWLCGGIKNEDWDKIDNYDSQRRE